MILVVDSGATKSDWIALSNSGEQLFMTQTLGLSPEVLTREVIEDRLANNYELSQNSTKVEQVHFYGAGCGTDRMKKFLNEIFKDFKANSTLSFVDFFENIDSIACAIASNPDDDFIILLPFITNSGTITK